MNESTKTKKALRGSLFALFLCIVLLIGTTFAWFTDTASTGVNKIQAGNLDVGLEYATAWNEDGTVKTWTSAEGEILDFQKAAGASEGEAILWEPGCKYKLPEIRVVNKGNLALKYTVKVTGIEGDKKLNEVIDWTIDDNALSDVEGNLNAGTKDSPTYSKAMTIQGNMQESAGNEYQDKSINGISITVVATQDTVENDSFGNTYDANAGYPVAKYSDMKKAFADGGSIAINDNITADESKTAAADRVTVKAPTPSNKDIAFDATGTIKSNVYVRETASTSAKKLGVLKKGTEVTIVAKTSTEAWYKVKYNDGYGYVSSKYVTLTSEQPEVQYPATAVANHDVYVRNGGSPKAKKLGAITKGTKVTVVEKCQYNWYKIQYKDGFGYVYGEYLDMVLVQK